MRDIENQLLEMEPTETQHETSVIEDQQSENKQPQSESTKDDSAYTTTADDTTINQENVAPENAKLMVNTKESPKIHLPTDMQIDRPEIEPCNNVDYDQQL